jgi:MFS transporter, DHA2 family, multidrug resistance protein
MASETPTGAPHPWLVALAVMAGTFMVVLDTTVVNVALPHIAGSLSATVEETTWSLTSYLAANAIILPITGWLAATFGRRRLLITAVISFTAASLLCGVAPTLAFLIVFRVIQGATGGVMQPLSQAVMLEAFSARERGKAMGFWGVGIVVAPILGPVLGGWLTDSLSWRWVFYINLPVGIVAVLMIRAFVHDPAYLRRPSRGVDLWGLALMTVGFGALQVALDKGEQNDWLESTLIVLLLGTALVALTTLVVRELRAEHPILDLSVLRHRTFATGVGLITLMGIVLYGSLVMLPVLLQTLMGYPAYEAGLAMAPRGLGSMIAMPLVGLLVAHVDPRKLLGAGFALGGVSLLWLGALDLSAGYWDFFWPQFVQGVAFGLLFVPLTTVTMDPIPRHGMGNATSLFNLMRNIGGSVGIAAVQTLLSRHRQEHIAILGAHVDAYSEASRGVLRSIETGLRVRGVDGFSAAQGALGTVWGIVQREAAMLSFIDTFRMLGILFLLLTPVSLFMHRPTHAADAAPVAAE